MTYDVAPLQGYHPEIGILLATLDDSTREWRENLEEPPVEAIVWQPYPQGYSIGGLLLHIIDVETGWIDQFAAGIAEDPAEAELFMGKQTLQDDGVWPTPHSQPIGWYLDHHDRIRTRIKNTLLELDDPARLYQGRENSFTLRWILAHVVGHDSYHGGQAVVLHEMWKRLKT